MAVLKAASTSVRWNEVKGAIGLKRGATVYDATVHNVLENLKAAMLVSEEDKVYRVNDPMFRTLLLTSQIT